MKPAKSESSDSVESSDEFEVPEGWVYKKLGEIVSPSKEKIEPTADSTIPYIGLEHIESNTSKIIGHGIANEVRSTKTVFHSGDVLYGKLRPYLNKVTIPDFDGVCSTDILVFNQNQTIDSRYLMRYLSTREVVEYANLKSKGISLPRVSFESLAEISIPLPPLAEQQRIVARVEALLTHVNAARDRVSRVPLIMKKFRQAVLAAAYSGSLTEGWRQENPDSQSIDEFFKKVLATFRLKNKHDRIVCNSDEDIPESWNQIPLKMIFKWSHGNSLPQKKIVQGIYPVFGGNGITGTHTQFLIEKEGLVIGRVGASCGNIHLIPPKSWITDNAIYSSSYPNGTNLKFFYYLLKNKNLNNLSGGSGQPFITQTILNDIWINFPPLAEQHEIVCRVDALFERADAIEREVLAASRRCERLTQAVMGKAFRGRL